MKGVVVAVLGTQYCGEYLHRAGKATWYTRSQDSLLTFAPYGGIQHLKSSSSHCPFCFTLCFFLAGT